MTIKKKKNIPIFDKEFHTKLLILKAQLKCKTLEDMLKILVADYEK